MEREKSFENHLRNLILQEKIDQPLLFKGIHKEWEPCTWKLDDWGELFKNEKLTVKYGKQNWDGLQPQWESTCGKEDLTWKEIIDWSKGDSLFLPENGRPEDIWVYYDYKYLPDVFQFKSSSDKRDFLKIIYFNENLKKKFCWSKLGFPDRNSDHSTLWCGSAGSYTPCHFDTYSCNLICQVSGRKTWLVFPPKDGEYLLQTRIPYEESSVYSRINFASSKRIAAHIQELEKCNPLKVTLEAGDCLYLPPKWWHYVKSEDFSISVNTWIELPGDHSTRVEEAVLRSIVSTVVNMTFPDAANRILNPNEMDVADLSAMDINELLQSASSAYIESQGEKMLEETKNLNTTEQDSDNSSVQQNVYDAVDNESPPTKRLKPLEKNKMVTLDEFLELYPNIVKTLSSFSYKSFVIEDYSTTNKLVKSTDGNNSLQFETEDRSPTYLEHLINAIGHPTILKQISTQFLLNVSHNPPK